MKKPGNSWTRRDFMKVFGYGIASAAVLAACKRSIQHALPYINQPQEITPGKALYYASGFFDGHEYASIIVKVRDGRPIKIEGNPLSPFNGEGTTARVQASVLSLYDDARLKNPAIYGKDAKWDSVDEQLSRDLADADARGGEIALLTSTIISPATRKLISEFGRKFRKFRWVQYDAVSHSAILEANRICFGKAVIPDYIFHNADVVVSVNSDFLGTWLCPVHFIPDYVSRRKPGNGERDMLRHIHFESGVTITGATADERRRMKPSEEILMLTDLYNRIAGKIGGSGLPGPPYREDLSSVAGELIASRGRSLVISGTNNLEIQVIVNRINYLLGNYQGCIDLNNCLNIAAGIDTEMHALVGDMKDGKIGALLMYNVNPLFDYPDSQGFIAGLKKTEVTVDMAVSRNETTGKAKYECPVSHYLESWDDAEIIPGQLGLSQPCISPIFNARSFQDSILKWTGNPLSYHDYLSASWQADYFPASGMAEFKAFWNSVLGKGIYIHGNQGISKPVLNEQALTHEPDTHLQPSGKIEIVLTESIPLGNGMHANNPWLMELPDPVSKHCWENVAAISPVDAKRLGLLTGDQIRIMDGLILPVFIQPGQADGTISVSIGYGHTSSGPVADHNGVNVYPFAEMKGNYRTYWFSADEPVRTGRQAELALTQLHHSMEGRPIVRYTSLSRFRSDPGSGNEAHRSFEEEHRTLYPEPVHKGFHWGMAIDLNACVGCNACVIACQAENNIPTVGKSEVTRHRIMHWLKVDRYYSDDQASPQVFFQPLPCQHCDNAPCENVCPVSATNHSSEGLNQMAYNRCVGTKYCINNCPYRVRRFNWFRYTNNKVFDYNSASDLGRMVLNPDVVVRERGVVEKCSYCVQRIQEKKLQAKLENRTLRDLEIKTACMQACPAGAIVFGNLLDPESRVSRILSSPRTYHLLESLHTLPATGYLTRISNDGANNS